MSGELPVGPTFVREFVRVAEAKLGQLQARKEHIRGRMHALRYLAQHAEGDSRSCAAKSGSAPPQFSIATDVPEATRQAGLPAPTFHSQDKLRRACRIALLESDTPQSCADIYQRINKRGSHSFGGCDNVLQILAAELQRMAANSEILCLMVNGEAHWQAKHSL